MGAEPAAKISNNHSTRNETKTVAVRLKPALSIQMRLYRWSRLFGIMGTNPVRPIHNAAAHLWFRPVCIRRLPFVDWSAALDTRTRHVLSRTGTIILRNFDAK